MKKENRVLKKLGRAAVAVVWGLLHLWALLALYFWFHSHAVMGLAVVAVYAGMVLLVFRLAGSRPHAAWVSLVLFAAVAAWWMRREPETGLRYPKETEQAAKLSVDGNQLTVHGMRTFHYRNATDAEARWSTRVFDLDQLEYVDFCFNDQGMPGVAHVITSFVFRNQPPLAVSIEPRVEIDEPNTLLRGCFKQYELFYLWADERDVVRWHTQFQSGPVALHRSSLTPEQGRRLLMEMALRSNELEDQPAFYNTLTDHGVHVIARHLEQAQGRKVPWFRLPLLTGKYEKQGYDEGWLLHSLPWEQHRAAAMINDRSRVAGEAPDFSQRIRTHLPAPAAPVEQYPSQ